METLNVSRSLFVAFPDGEPVSTLPGNALKASTKEPDPPRDRAEQRLSDFLAANARVYSGLTLPAPFCMRSNPNERVQFA
jgi:hypothetical protein